MKKTTVIIGAGPGLGLAVAKKFGSEGFETVLVARNEEKLKVLCKELSDCGVKASYEVADSADSKKLSNAIETIKTQYGTPDCVVYM